MKYIIILAVSFLFGCYETTPEQQIEDRQYKERWKGFYVVVIDSCEYISRWEGTYAGYRFSHKGNCKFCEQRKCK
jgi:hypothetical protein